MWSSKINNWNLQMCTYEFSNSSSVWFEQIIWIQIYIQVFIRILCNLFLYFGKYQYLQCVNTWRGDLNFSIIRTSVTIMHPHMSWYIRQSIHAHINMSGPFHSCVCKHGHMWTVELILTITFLFIWASWHLTMKLL